MMGCRPWKEVGKDAHNVGQSLSKRTTFKAFQLGQLGTYLIFYDRLRRVTFLGHPV